MLRPQVLPIPPEPETPEPPTTRLPEVGEECALIVLPEMDARMARIGVTVTNPGSTGALIRLGIRALNPDGLPGDVLLDAGLVEAVEIGEKEIAIDFGLVANIPVALTATAQLGPDSGPDPVPARTTTIPGPTPVKQVVGGPLDDDEGGFAMDTELVTPSIYLRVSD